MPRWFYVKSGGLLGVDDDTPYTSQQTDSFATLTTANYYGNLFDAINAGVKTNPATHGDFICVSDAHDYDYGSTNAYYACCDSTGKGATVISVSDTSPDTYSKGAKERTNNVYNMGSNGTLTFIGIQWITGNDYSVSGEEDQFFYDCTFTVGAGTDNPFTGGDCHVLLVGCTFEINTTGTTCNVGSFGSGVIHLVDCVWTTDSAYADTVFIGGAADYSRVICEGCDFSALSSTSLVDAANADATNNRGDSWEFYRCKLPSTFTSFWSAAPVNRGHYVLAVNSAASSTAAEYQYFFENGLGYVEEETGIYRANSGGFVSGQQISLKMVSYANVSPARLFMFDLPSRYAVLSNAASDTLSLYFICADTLTDADIFVDVVYADGTNKHTPNYLPSVANQFFPPEYRTGGALTTNTETWEGRTTQNRYQIDINTSSTGSDCIPSLRVYVTRPNTTIYICPTIGLS